MNHQLQICQLDVQVFTMNLSFFGVLEYLQYIYKTSPVKITLKDAFKTLMIHKACELTLFKMLIIDNLIECLTFYHDTKMDVRALLYGC